VVTVEFDEEWSDAIETLRTHLADVDTPEDAVAAAVAILSQYAGRPLYVQDDGKPRVIDGLWRS
jgi:hypothetical protein